VTSPVDQPRGPAPWTSPVDQPRLCRGQGRLLLRQRLRLEIHL